MAMYRVCYAKTETERDGSQKTYWPEIGVAFDRQGDEGLVVKVNAVPIGSLWDGTLFLFPIEGRSQKSKTRKDLDEMRRGSGAQGRPRYPHDEPETGNLPF